MIDASIYRWGRFARDILVVTGLMQQVVVSLMTGRNTVEGSLEKEATEHWRQQLWH